MNARFGMEHSAVGETAALLSKPVPWHSATVLDILYWTPTVFSIRITRPNGFMFTPGHYVRLGLDDGVGGFVWRPFSMVSGRDDPYLEFVIVLIPDGEFSGRLRQIAVGAEILVEKLSLGFLTLDQLEPGKDLWLLASGTGIGPFISLLRTPSLISKFEHIVLAHSVRFAAELTYQDEIVGIADALHVSYIPVVTRESTAGVFHERLPALLSLSALQDHAGIDLDVAHSRVMVCGNPELAKDMRGFLSARGFVTCRRGVPGQMVFEKYW